MNNMSPTGLVILDGWGLSDEWKYNAIKQAHTPNYDNLIKQFPATKLLASGEAVGLPEGQMGNSEVGHLTIAAGRVCKQSLLRINDSLQHNNFSDNATIVDFLSQCGIQNKALHLIVLLSDGGVHSHEEHLFGILKQAKQQQLSQVFIHVITDGRDTPPQSAKESLTKLLQLTEQLSLGKIASLCGRYYAMDRDRRWQRTEIAHRLIVEQQAEHVMDDPLVALQQAYDRGEMDEFIRPTALCQEAKMASDDFICLLNFRVDRMRQLTESLVMSDFAHFGITHTFKQVLTFTNYHDTYPASVAFPKQQISNTFGEWVAKSELRQLRIAETEKYPHVTFFFNGGNDVVFDKEERILINSPKVATYDLQPRMSVDEVVKQLTLQIDSGQFDTFICNLANPDMVGHSGDFSATVEAVEAVDDMLGKIVSRCQANGWQLLICADHGNADKMFDEATNLAHTAHTLAPVPCILYSDKYTQLRSGGSLIDIAPTLLACLGLSIPDEMTGQSLL